MSDPTDPAAPPARDGGPAMPDPDAAPAGGEGRGPGVSVDLAEPAPDATPDGLYVVCGPEGVGFAPGEPAAQTALFPRRSEAEEVAATYAERFGIGAVVVELVPASRARELEAEAAGLRERAERAEGLCHAMYTCLAFIAKHQPDPDAAVAEMVGGFLDDMAARGARPAPKTVGLVRELLARVTPGETNA